MIAGLYSEGWTTYGPGTVADSLLAGCNTTSQRYLGQVTRLNFRYAQRSVKVSDMELGSKSRSILSRKKK